MALQLNDTVKDYKEFYGRNTDQMPLLIAEGRTPMSAQGLMQRRLETLNSGDQDLIKTFWENYFDTGDAKFYNTNGNAKVVLDSGIMRRINPQSKLKNGALIISDDEYKALEGQEFTRDELNKYAKGESLSRKEVISNPIWKALARDQALLEEYAGKAFDKAKADHGYSKIMGVYVSDTPDVPVGRLWFVSRLINDSDAIARGNLDDDNVRLVGVAPKAQSASKNQASFALDDKVKDALIGGKAFQYNGLLYVPSADPSVKL